MPRFLLGINYWPRKSAMAMWTRFDLGEIDEDFVRIAGLGLEVVRFFLSWEVFQPGPDTIDPLALDRLEAVVNCAHARGLRTMPTFFSGHMSGVNWLPEWALDAATASPRFRTLSGGREFAYGIGDFYSGDLLAAQRRQVRAVGTRLRAHPAVYAWDLGNEFSNLGEPRSASDAAAWSAALTSDLLETSSIDVTGGIHGEDLTLDRRIRPSSLCAPWAFATMHGYPVYSNFSRAHDDPEVVPFLAALASAFSGKGVLFSEFGNPTTPPGKLPPPHRPLSSGELLAVAEAQDERYASFASLGEEEMARYARSVLERLHARGALGAFWWCWADYAADLAGVPPFDKAPHELHFGIVRNDGSEKPVAQALARFAAERRETMPEPEPYFADEEAYYAGLPGSLAAAYAAYVRRVEETT